MDAIELLRRWRHGDEHDQRETLDYLRWLVVTDDELEAAIERLQRCNPHIDPEAIRQMVLPAGDAEAGDQTRDYGGEACGR